uniref:(northern house mosquito) hypothetical protein n=1 Tax=Culex pipiens TaxID=7175 RepID=A0A8D8EX66_CULPI
MLCVRCASAQNNQISTVDPRSRRFSVWCCERCRRINHQCQFYDFNLFENKNSPKSVRSVAVQTNHGGLSHQYTVTNNSFEPGWHRRSYCFGQKSGLDRSAWRGSYNNGMY